MQNSSVIDLATVLADIRTGLDSLAQTEPLSSAGKGVLMMAGRLLAMLEADQHHVVSAIHMNGSEERSRVIDRYIATADALDEARTEASSRQVQSREANGEELHAAFCAYLARQARKPIRSLAKFRKIPGGYSKTSIAAELHPTDDFGWGTQLLVRMDVKDGPTSFTVADEFPILERLTGTSVPIAKPLACETDPSVLGQPFLVSELLPGISAASGDPTVAAWGGNPATRRELGIQIARALGALHAVELAQRTSSSPQEQVRSYLNEWRQRWLGLQAPAEPGLELAFDWLAENVPTRIDRLAYVHGDFAPYNALQDQGRLTAIIDWEFIHLGDPAEDVGYCRKYMESLLPWHDFLHHYYASGGPEYREESAAFYEVWCNVRNAVVLLQGRQAYVSGRNRDLKTLYAPAEFYHYFLRNALQGIRARL
ncbi:MAG: phosphotransferase family protein [Steroidobacteraceae bacterium]